jgi:hypothetical protein
VLFPLINKIPFAMPIDFLKLNLQENYILTPKSW